MTATRAARRRAVWALGGAQCVLWGLLYYAFAVLLVPLQRELGASRVELAGAYSVGLLVMALGAPAVGRRIDAGEAPRVIRGGVVLAILGLTTLAAAHDLPTVYLAWLVLGVAMACVLYETALGLILRAFEDAQRRLRAASAVTVLGGLASTIFLPALAMAIDAWGWRLAVVASAVAVGLVGLALERWVYAPLSVPMRDPPTAGRTGSSADVRYFAFHAYAVAGTLAAMTLTVLLVPLLVDRGVPLSFAATVLALLGVSQLPGRLWLLGGRAPSARALAVAPIALQGAGLLLVALPSTGWGAVLGVAVFGLGAGLHTVARPWLVERRVGALQAGRVNAVLARSQGLARAGGPLAAMLLATWADGAIAMIAVGTALLLLLPLVATMAGE